MNGVVVEIRAAEGGDDAKQLVGEQFSIYTALCKLHELDCEITDERPGLMVFQAFGGDAEAAFAMESGGHRWQRVPPTERRGRRHTSTVTVAVFPIPQEIEWTLDASEIVEEAIHGSRASGGQHQQKNATVIRAKHVPTGITVTVSGRHQHANRIAARRELEGRVAALRLSEQQSTTAAERKRQVGSGQRGDKIRTVRMQDGRVVDHRTGKRMSTERYLKGHIGDLT
jgi:peptide chain release factor 1